MKVDDFVAYLKTKTKLFLQHFVEMFLNPTFDFISKPEQKYKSAFYSKNKILIISLLVQKIKFEHF